MKKLTIRISLDRYLQGAMLDGEITIKRNDSKKLNDLYEKVLQLLCPPIEK